MSGLDIEQCIYKKIILSSLKYFLLISLYLIFITIAYAGPVNDIHNGIEEKSGDSACIQCHSSYQEPPGTVKSTDQQKTTKAQIQMPAATGVIGDLTLIVSPGQKWYQQGINGLGQKTWGWTFFDEIGNSSEKMTPAEEMTQRNNIYALVLDSGNNSSPVRGARVTANITYWLYDGAKYTNNTVQVNFTEDGSHNGFYKGIFYFSGNSTSSSGCSYCHSMHEQYSPQSGNFPGNYTGTVTAQVDNKNSTKDISFEVTSWGCEDCHGSPNPHKSGLLIAGEACYLCHSLSDMGHDEAVNPHQIIDHRSINCIDCHTNKSLSPITFNGVTFITGGINNSRTIPQYNFTTTSLNGGTHLNLTCTACHDDLGLPAQEGGFKEDNYTIRTTINNYTPDFMSIQQFQDYYAVNVTSGGPLNITFDWEGTSNIGFFMFPPGYVPDIGVAPYYDGSTFTNKPERYSNSVPVPGDWILVVYGYDFIAGLKIGKIQTALNYTLDSTYPLQKKNLPHIPECNSCHNSNGSGKTFTSDIIPNWNPGFAHVDTNDDGAPDIQCRMCHDAMHDITVKDCHDCHTRAPVSHPIRGPEFDQKTPGQCLECHGDPHKVTSAGGTDCVACHSPGDVNISRFARHADINTSDGPGIVTNNDCWTCHYQKDMYPDHVYLCDSCHVNSSGVVEVGDPLLIKTEFWHGMTGCKNCHAPITYHNRGTTGPLGAVENLGKVDMNK